MSYIITKNGSLERPKNITYADFISASYGTEYEYTPVDTHIQILYFTQSSNYSEEKYRKFKSLKNVINRNRELDDIYKFENLLNNPSTLICLSSYHLGSGIEKGSVELSLFYSGSLASKVSDKKENGVLYNENDGKVGIVLYEHGFILLNDTNSLAPNSTEFEGYGTTTPQWIFFGALSQSNLYYNFDLKYQTKNTNPTTTVFVEANKNELNHSNNFSYIKYDTYSYTNSSSSFNENKFIEVKKTNKSPFTGGDATFEKQTFISKIGLYDDSKKLIAVASLANPVRKTENREFIFKLKLDL